MGNAIDLISGRTARIGVSARKIIAHYLGRLASLTRLEAEDSPVGEVPGALKSFESQQEYAVLRSMSFFRASFLTERPLGAGPRSATAWLACSRSETRRQREHRLAQRATAL
jgi:hypothetical protein